MKINALRTVAMLATTMLLCHARLAGSTDLTSGFCAASQAKYALKREAFRTGNADILKEEFYDKNAIILGDGYAIVGGEAIYEGYRKLLPSRKDIEISVLRSMVSQDGTLAYEITRVQPTAADPAQSLPAQTVLFVWRKAGNTWRVTVEMSVKGDMSIPPLP